MKTIVLRSLLALMLSFGFLASQVEAKDKDKNENKGSNRYENEYKEYKNKDNKGWNKYYGNPGSKGSVPIPGTLLLFGGGFAGLILWRMREPRP